MKVCWTATAFALVIASSALPAHACRMRHSLVPGDARNADVVVVGRIAKYELVLDREARRELRRSLAKSPAMPPQQRMLLERKTWFRSDYARFQVEVEQVLSGVAPKTISVTWDSPSFGEPESMPPGPWLIALRYPRANAPPLRGPIAREPRSLMVMEALCSEEFMLESGSRQASAVKKILADVSMRRPQLR